MATTIPKKLITPTARSESQVRAMKPTAGPMVPRIPVMKVWIDM